MIKSLLSFLLITLMAITVCFSQNRGESSSSFSEKELKEAKTSIELYPNPVTEFLYIEIESSYLDNVEFEVFNIIGNSINIDVEKVSHNKFKIPVRTLSSGYYLLTISDKTSKYYQHFKFQKK